MASSDSLQWHTVGAHLLQACVASGPVFYCSPLISKFTDRPPRGGVPVMFPQFADRGAGPKHGLVRLLEWEGVEGRSDTFTIDVPPQADKHWLGHARLTVSASVTSQALEQRLRVENIGNSAFPFTGGLHPYWAVADVEKLQIAGLNAVAFEDRYGASQAVSAPFLQGQAFERLYLQAPAITLSDGVRLLELTCSGFDNWMVWNPGVELAKGLPDLPPDDWTRFVCVEPVVAAKPVVLQPGGVFEGVMHIREV